MSDQLCAHQWIQVPLRDLVVRFSNGGTPDTARADYWGEGVPWVTGADFSEDGSLVFRRFVTDVGLRNSAASVARRGDILVVTRTGVGKLAIAPCDIAVSQDITGVRPDLSKVDETFLYFLLKSEIEKLKRISQGTSINGIVRSDLEGCLVSLPQDLGLQREIARALSGMCNASNQTELLIEKYQQIKAGLMHDLFTRGVLPNGQLRSVSEMDCIPFFSGSIPKEWSVTSLQKMERSGSHWIKTGPFGSALKGEHWRNQGVPVVTIGSLGSGRFIETELLYVSESDADRLSEFRLRNGDVVFSRVADVGRSVVVRVEQVGWIMSSNLMRIAVDPAVMRPEFLQFLLSFDHRIKAQIRMLVNSGGRDLANSEVLSQLRFPLPEPSEQDRIIAYVGKVDARLESEQLRLEKFLRQKTGLMQDLLTGKVPVPVPEHEATDG